MLATCPSVSAMQAALVSCAEVLKSYRSLPSSPVAACLPALQEVEREWQTYPPALQQNLHETAFLVAVDRSWAHLEEGLRLELQTAG